MEKCFEQQHISFVWVRALFASSSQRLLNLRREYFDILEWKYFLIKISKVQKLTGKGGFFQKVWCISNLQISKI